MPVNELFPPIPDSWGCIIAFIFGACIGSFLNVVIYRSPLNLSLNEPKRSFCPTCKQGIPWYHNIPLVSWLVLRGKCARCKTKITIRYWLVEGLTALLFALIYYLYPVEAALPLMGWITFAIVIAFIDAENLIVLPRHAWLGTLFALITVSLYPEIIGQELWYEGLLWGALNAIIGFFLIRIIIELGKLVFGKQEFSFEKPTPWSLRDAQDDQDEVTLILGDKEIPWSFIFHRPKDKVIFKNAEVSINGKESMKGDFTMYFSTLTQDDTIIDLREVQSVKGKTTYAFIPREAMGSGDAYIFMMICALTGWQSIPIVLFTASILGILFAFTNRLGLGSRLPFGPLLLLGGLFWLLYGQQLWHFYLSFSERSF